MAVRDVVADRSPGQPHRGEAPASPVRARPLELGAVALATVLTLGLCLHGLGSRSLWLDEAAHVVIAQQRGAAFWRGIAGDGGNQALYDMLLRVVTGLFGISPFVVRLPSALAAAATVPVSYALTRQLFDARAAVIGAFVVGVSLPLVYWGQSADGYAIGVMLATACCYAFVRVLDGAGRVALVVYVVVTMLMLYTLMLTGLVLAAQAVSLAFRGRGATPWRRLVSGGAAIAVLSVPLALLATAHGTADIDWLSPPTTAFEHDALRALTSAGNAPEYPPVTGTSTLLVIVTLVLWLAGAAVLGYRLSRRDKSRAAFAPAFLVCWLVVPVVADYLVSVAAQPIFITRYLLTSLPAASLLAAVVLSRVRPVALAAVAAAGLVVLRLVQIPPSYGKSTEEWRTPTAYVLEQTRAGDCVAFFVDDSRMPFEYYLRQGPARPLLPRPILPPLGWSANPVEVEVSTPIAASALPLVVAGCGRVFVVASHDGFPNGTPTQQVTYARYVRMIAELRAHYAVPQSVDFGTVTVWTFSRTATP